MPPSRTPGLARSLDASERVEPVECAEDPLGKCINLPSAGGVTRPLLARHRHPKTAAVRLRDTNAETRVGIAHRPTAAAVIAAASVITAIAITAIVFIAIAIIAVTAGAVTSTADRVVQSILERLSNGGASARQAAAQSDHRVALRAVRVEPARRGLDLLEPRGMLSPMARVCAQACYGGGLVRSCAQRE